MSKRVFGAFVLAMLVACGGEEGAAPPPATPPPAPAPTPAPTPTTTAAATPPAPEPPKPTMAELQKKSVAATTEAFNGHDAKKMSALYAQDAVFVNPGMEGAKETKGRDAIEKDMGEFFTGFPDAKVGNVRVIQKGDVVVVEWVLTGTNTGDAYGMKATGKKTGYAGASLMWFDDAGLVKREHMYFDHMTMMGQMGQGDPKAKPRPVMELPKGEAVWITSKDEAAEKKNVDIATSFYTVFEKKDEKAFLDSMSDDMVRLDYSAPPEMGESKGKAAHKKDFQMMTKAMPDAKITPKTVIGAGDVVVADVEFTGTFKGPMGPMKPTKKTGTVHGLDVVELKDGKATKVISYGSGLEFAAQFGLLPPPPKPKADPKAPAAAKPAAAPGAKAASPATPATPATAAKPATPAAPAAPAKPATPAAPAAPAKPATPAAPAAPAAPKK